jgi:hypothetical protein
VLIGLLKKFYFISVGVPVRQMVADRRRCCFSRPAAPAGDLRRGEVSLLWLFFVCIEMNCSDGSPIMADPTQYLYGNCIRRYCSLCLFFVL